MRVRSIDLMKLGLASTNARTRRSVIIVHAHCTRGSYSVWFTSLACSSLGRAALWTFAPQIGRGLSRMATGSGVDQAKCVYNSEVNSPAGCELLACPLGALGPPSPVPGYKTVLKKTLMNKARAATDSPLRAHKENENDKKTECKPMADSSSSAPRFPSDNNAIDTAVCAAQSYERPPRTAIGYIPVLSSSY